MRRADGSGVSSLREAILRALVLVTGLGLAPASAHALPKIGSGAVVTSVDGASDLTVKIGTRKLPVRLFNVDAPWPGECGAEQATVAMRGFVRRAPRRLHFAFAMRGRALARDERGRLLVSLAYPVRKRWRDLGNDLMRAGWAREGARATFDTPVFDDANLPVLPDEAHTADEELRYRTGRGLVTVCGGLTHLPLGSAVPKWEARPVWNVDARGVATSIGPVVLDATRAMSVQELATIAPLELRQFAALCWVSSPTLGLATFLGGSEGRCGDALVVGFLTDGTRAPKLSRGGGVDESLRTAKAAYPLLDLDDPNLWLSGTRDQQSAWQTRLFWDPNGDDTATALTTLQAPPELDANHG